MQMVRVPSRLYVAADTLLTSHLCRFSSRSFGRTRIPGTVKTMEGCFAGAGSQLVFVAAMVSVGVAHAVHVSNAPLAIPSRSSHLLPPIIPTLLFSKESFWIGGHGQRGLGGSDCRAGAEQCARGPHAPD